MLRIFRLLAAKKLLRDISQRFRGAGVGSQVLSEASGAQARDVPAAFNKMQCFGSFRRPDDGA